ncbi:hypothetical protein, partial [Enterobacter hormaechei]|uniref:hypothetical protein n=1 Tax=Enterobacter hormaechei TaxID=158836 RepID=UPI001C3EC628
NDIVRLDFGSTQTMLFPDVPSLNAIFSFSKILFLAMILYSSFGITIKSYSLFETFMISKKLVLVMLVFRTGLYLPFINHLPFISSALADISESLFCAAEEKASFLCSFS